MRLGKEQSAGYVEEGQPEGIEVTEQEQVSAPAAAMAAEPAPVTAADEPVTAAL